MDQFSSGTTCTGFGCWTVTSQIYWQKKGREEKEDNVSPTGIPQDLRKAGGRNGVFLLLPPPPLHPLLSFERDTVDSISYVLFFVWKNKIVRLSDSLQIFRRALLWSHLFPTVWMRSAAQKIMGFFSTWLSLPRFFGRFEWKIENKKYT